ncbi:flagellar motor protein MotB [uncultured Tateyamaria sp.]|uniref:flagellar motor protein MotB n=1 Tax=uncultured Tateyamaria sp. TaxID=455651 RepID=UPI0026310722|nr:flagellar motor protein MotB [uncultured Tateyamaria sp.]
MSAQANVRPIIIKRKKVVGGGGHHGGAWKVAYADFVTAMMAFFMLMWLLNATTEKQRKGIADYFSPTIPINRVSGGGDGSFGGDSVFSEVTLPQNGTGASSQRPTESRQARGETGMSDTGDALAAQDEAFESLEAQLIGHGGESKVMDNEMQHITTRLTDEGLVIEIFALDDTPLFEGATDEPTPLLENLARLISESTRMVENGIAIGGHVQAQPIVVAERSTWKLSADRATTMRKLLEDFGVAEARIQRVTGHADRERAVANPMATRNNRLEIVLLRE